MVENSIPYELIDVPGEEDVRILAISRSTSHSHYNESGSKSPWWMISMKHGSELLSSTITGSRDSTTVYNKFAELYGFHIESSRETVADLANQLFTSAMIKHEDCIVILPNGGYATDIENAMYTGKPMSEIKIICLGWFDGALNITQMIFFENSYIIALTHDLDRIVVKFRVQKKTYTYFDRNQDSTVVSGQAVCTLDLSENTVT